MTRHSDRKDVRKKLADERKTYYDALSLEDRLKKVEERPGKSENEVAKIQAQIVARDAPKPVKKEKKKEAETTDA